MSRIEIRSCEDALRLLAAHLDEELDARESGQVTRHLATCRSCYSRAEFERRLKERLAALGSEAVRPELTDRIQKLVSTFTVVGGE